MRESFKLLRARVPRGTFAQWASPGDRIDPLELLREQERHRVTALLPIRHARMAQSPFAFYRGAAAIMAADLVRVPITGLLAQISGDAHLMNFGAFATPERNVVFDVNDFDETLPGPWEFDVARLCASLPIAASDRGFRASTGESAVFAAAYAYRRAMRRYAGLAPMTVWYDRVDVVRMLAKEVTMKASAERLVPRLTRGTGGETRFIDRPPLFTRLQPDDPMAVTAHGVLRSYRRTLLQHVRVLFDRYHLVDIATKVVGVGSVGTQCMIVLMIADDDQPLLLQLKEAQASVYEAYLGRSPFANHGERVVSGQRLMQAASDIFLGWTKQGEHHFYVRELRDMKATLDIEVVDAEEFVDYASHCGVTLARAHARSGNPAAIAGYLGKNDVFDDAMLSFATSYAAQNERDYDAFADAVKRGEFAVES